MWVYNYIEVIKIMEKPEKKIKSFKDVSEVLNDLSKVSESLTKTVNRHSQEIESLAFMSTAHGKTIDGNAEKQNQTDKSYLETFSEQTDKTNKYIKAEMDKLFKITNGNFKQIYNNAELLKTHINKFNKIKEKEEEINKKADKRVKYNMFFIGLIVTSLIAILTVIINIVNK